MCVYVCKYISSFSLDGILIVTIIYCYMKDLPFHTIRDYT